MDWERFRKVLGMLGSDQPGERSAAALRATAMLKEHGMQWGDVSIEQAASAQKPPAGDTNVLLRTLEKVEAIKSALATEKVRVRILENQVTALKQQICEVSQPPTPVEESPMPKRRGSIWGW